MFIDVLCIFAQDCGGLDGVADVLAARITIGSASSLPISTRPRLVVVTSISEPEFEAEALRFRLRVLSDPKFPESFSKLSVVNVLNSTRLPLELFGELETALQDEIGAARLERMNTHTLFSMIHTTDFFNKAIRNFASSPLQAFDFIRCTREDHPVSPSFQQHIESFLGLCSENKISERFLWDFIASAIVLDGFPADMHRESRFLYWVTPG
jgi:hypothetical protein